MDRVGFQALKNQNAGSGTKVIKKLLNLTRSALLQHFFLVYVYELRLVNVFQRASLA